MAAFSDKNIKSLVITGVNYRRYEGGSDPGFGVQVTAAGVKTFFYQYTHDGRRRFLRLGTYPDTTLAEARQRARAARSQVDQGVDPQEDVKKRVREAKSRGSVQQLTDAFIEHMKANGRRSADEVKRCLEKDVLPHIGAMAARDVSPAHIREILYRLISRKAAVQANRVRSYLHTMFKYGIHHDNDPRSLGAEVLFGIAHNPVEAVPKNAAVENAHDRNLSWDEIRTIWNTEGIHLPYRLAIRLLLATGGQRSGEVTRAAWSEFDLDAGLWLLPAARVKNKRDHLIPLTSLAVDILNELRGIYPGSKWLFPGRHNPLALKPWNESTLPHAVQDYCTETGMVPWTPKDLRRTVKTRMGELGIDKLVRDRIQNHALNDVSAKHYDRYDYVAEKRAALEIWCRQLGQLTSSECMRPNLSDSPDRLYLRKVSS
ncbi:site-specific integrase [Methylococcus sp. EFPC2]|uniref:tyrosine-type recombinase/integrase n=1 Tax=Methylococcus sp. EFPC2 TaxID=2812648 RepID=UPI001968947F|nr:site-specific integrase [Methylococcus sp. EFPC2]QSA98145.1 integrase arm-type DNA-binding domain-containing protein [Methylococcus sp. EFPC2]